MSAIRRVAVVVPARNEEHLLPRCLDSVQDAAALLAQQRPDLLTRVTVVLDRTTDGSPRAVRRRPGIRGIRSRSGNVGLARDRGVRAALRQSRQPEPGIWIATTDADSIVPPDWLCTQIQLAESGWDVLVGTVQPDPRDLSEELLAVWHAGHRLAEGHPHIHGANLGFRADVHTRLGGFGAHKVHEDHVFVSAAAAAGFRLLSTDRFRVTTSGRLQSRVRGGFADFLAASGAAGQVGLTG